MKCRTNALKVAFRKLLRTAITECDNTSGMIDQSLGTLIELQDRYKEGKAALQAKDGMSIGNVLAMIEGHLGNMRIEQDAARSLLDELAARVHGVSTEDSAQPADSSDTSTEGDVTPERQLSKLSVTVHVGYKPYIVRRGNWSGLLGDDAIAEQPSNAEYFFVGLTARNKDNKPRISPPLKLVDGSGNEFEAASNVWVLDLDFDS